MKKSIPVVLLFVLFLSSYVFAAQYGKGRFNIGVYGVGEEEDGGGISAVPVTRFFGGSASVRISQGNSINITTPDDIDDGISSVSEFNCISSLCSIRVREVSTEGFPESVISYSAGKNILGAIMIDCGASELTGSTNFLINASKNTNCNNLEIIQVIDDSINKLDVECSELTGIIVNYENCGYISLLNSQEVLAGPSKINETQQEKKSSPPVLTQGPPILIEKGSSISLLLTLIFGIIIFGFAVYLIYKRKKSKVQSQNYQNPAYYAPNVSMPQPPSATNIEQNKKPAEPTFYSANTIQK